MCSIADVMIEDEFKLKGNKLNICKKCLTDKPSLVLRKTDAYCKTCFLTATVHKFRASLGKHRIIRPNEKVLILYQTGHPSTALLHFLRIGLDLATHKKLRLEPVILFIDEHKQLQFDDRLLLYRQIANEINSYKFEGYVTALHSHLSNKNYDMDYHKLDGDLDDFIKNIALYSNTNINLTEYEDTANICRRQLLIKFAKELQCKTVFIPDISEDIAIQLLNNVSLGRGSHISLDTGILDDRDSEIKVLQPLRYFEMKEFAMYNVFNHLNPIHIKNPSKKNVTASVNTLISKFVMELQENYPSTVKTVVKTGDKLTCDKKRNICEMCKAPIEVQEKLSSSEARDFSHWVSLNASNLGNNEVGYISQNAANNFCYGCKALYFLRE